VPTGPAVVVWLTVLAIGSALFAPARGILAQWTRQNAHTIQIACENTLKAIYQYQERTQRSGPYSPSDRIFSFMPWPLRLVVFYRLKAQHMLLRIDRNYLLTQTGREEGIRIVRRHRLWEMYLAEELKVAPDHVHDEAESLEHIITPEIERRLEAELNYPAIDPHAKEIPRIDTGVRDRDSVKG
jgi:manganese/zinc/iron transport system permease protein